MMKLWLDCIFIVMALTGIACQQPAPSAQGSSDPVTHEQWTRLLEKHVRVDGLVSYQGFVNDTILLNSYLNLLATHHPAMDWTGEQQMAFWINAYNAFTIKLIVDNYPVESIKDIKKGIPFVNSVWDIKFIEIGEETYDLNAIEHRILRREFGDARIHAAINCASISCPMLSREAYRAEDLDAQLDEAMYRFINDPSRNRITAETTELSEIFNWFGGDFKDDAGSVRAFVNLYARIPIPKRVKISYLEYNWSLNNAQ
jgi:hypothetical protein